MIDALAKDLAAEIRQSREYAAYTAAREKVLADGQTAALVSRFHKLQMTVQARRLSGADGGAEEEELKKLAEYSLNKLLTNTYDTIAKGVGVDFTEWER